jgi:quercetin dioxygenase-like cupin family protein
MNRHSKGEEREAPKLPPAAAVTVGRLAGYAKGSVVSRTLVQNKAGSVTLFAFDRGQELSEHTAPFDALVHVLDGKVRLTIGGKPIVAAAGQAVLMPARVPHAVLAVQRFKMLLVMLRGT